MANCIGSRWLEWKVVFLASRVVLHHVKVVFSGLRGALSVGALTVVFVWSQRSSSLSFEDRLRSPEEMPLVDPESRLRMTARVVVG